MTPTIRFVVITALRDRLFASLLGLLLLAFSVSAFLGSSAIIEQREMTVVYAAGAARMIVVLGLIVFAAFHVERLYETREIEAILSRAISRGTFVLSYWIGLAAITFCFIAPVAVAVLCLGLSQSGAAYWVLTIVCESGIVLAFALFCALTLERAIPTIFVVTGFYGLARLIGFFAGIADHGAQDGVNRILNPVLHGIFYAVPRLDLFGQTRWLVYGAEGSNIIALCLLQTVIFVALLLAAAVYDLRNKHF